jgi:tetratricopeptide (TPR) repeat protein
LAYTGKGYTLHKLKRYQEALAAYELAIHLDPNLAVAYNNKGWALNALKRYQEALAACRREVASQQRLAGLDGQQRFIS